MERREFLKAAFAFGLCSALPLLRGGRIIGEAERGSRVDWARLKFPVTADNRNTQLGWFYHPSGDLKLIDWIRKETDINIKEDWSIVNVDDLGHMCAFPMLFLSGKGKINLNQRQKDNMREYLQRGGFLFSDDCVALRQPKEDVFFDSVHALVREILPKSRTVKLLMNHPVFHCYYDIKKWPHLQGVNNGLWATYLDNRLIMLNNSSDLHCGWTGFHFTQEQRRGAFQMAANIYVYVMNH